MKMASLNKVALESDDEDDVESLRLAALKSLKPKIVNETQNKLSGNNHSKLHLSYNKPSTFGAAQTTRHHNRGFRNNNGRTGRNGMNPRRTNTNLISIQTIDQDEPKEATLQVPIEAPKLILPQDRYHKSQGNDDMQRENSSTKFSRYDNSEDSESDSEELAMKSRRERKGSVELLMDQLENEINLLDAKPEQKLNEDDRLSDSNKLESEEIQNDTLIISDPDIVQLDEPSSPDKIETPVISDAPVESKKSRSRSPLTEKPHSQKRKSLTKSRSRSPIISQYKSPYRSPKRSRSPPRKVRYSPPYSTPLSPLSLNAEVLNTITMAPLSPRSAAFVLQNRQILARRQMSPRRSRSRENSCRRSLTPKRNKSPRRRSRTPTKRSSTPPRRRSNSPRNNHYRRSPYKPTKRSSHSPMMTNKSIHKRLGSRPNSRNESPHIERKVEVPLKRKRSSRSISLSLSPSPDRNYHKRPLNETTGHVNNDRNKREKPKRESPKEEPKSIDDPILEARRRKFESPLQINNGIIKLKSNKPEESNKEEVNLVEKQIIEESPKEKDLEEEIEEAEEILDLNPTLDDLWSDEDSDDDENEGRFKSKPSSENKCVPVMPFRKLTERPIPNSLTSRNANDHRDRRIKRQRRKRSRSPVKTTNKTESKKDFESKEHGNVKSKTMEKNRAKTTEEEKKRDKHIITVKSDTNKNIDNTKTSNPEKSVKRKVKIQVPDATDGNLENTIEPEIIIENEDETVTSKDDDLRAELSRRRAQRLIIANSLAEALPARLLKNALQEVVPKRSPTKNVNGCGNSADRRVLILKRLASSPTPQPEPATKVTSAGGKLPIHMRLGSNPEIEEPARPERRNRKAKSGRRKKQVQV